MTTMIIVMDIAMNISRCSPKRINDTMYMNVNKNNMMMSDITTINMSVDIRLEEMKIDQGISMRERHGGSDMAPLQTIMDIEK